MSGQGESNPVLWFGGGGAGASGGAGAAGAAGGAGGGSGGGEYFQSFHKIAHDEGNLENFENTTEINSYLHESTCDYLFITCRAKFCTKDNFQGLAVA